MSKIVHKGNVGTVITVTIMEDGSAKDLSAISSFGATIHLYNRDTDTTTNFTASLVGDGTEGKISYTTTSANDLSEAGECFISATITGAGGYSCTTNDREKIYVVEHPS